MSRELNLTSVVATFEPALKFTSMYCPWRHPLFQIYSPNSDCLHGCGAEVEEYAYTDYNYENYKNYGDYYEEPEAEEKGKI